MWMPWPRFRFSLMKNILELKKVFIIAEAGVNHNGDMDLARGMIDEAAKAGADAVKFQSFKTEKLVCQGAPKAEYQKQNTGQEGSQFDMLKKLELDVAAHKELQAHCHERNVEFISSPFDLDSVDLLGRMKLDIIKIPSGEITNLPYLRKVGALKRRVILSTGMAELAEIKSAIDVLMKAGTPKSAIIILQCHTDYPTSYEHVHLKAMQAMKDAFGVHVGLSDHTLGIEVPIAAVALGAQVIEKHFTLDKNMQGPDHQASLEPREFRQMVDAIRNVEKALGEREKKPTVNELKNRAIVRKSIVAAQNIKKGETFSESNIAAKRPATGLSPMQWDNVLGQKAKRDFTENEVIEL